MKEILQIRLAGLRNAEHYQLNAGALGAVSESFAEAKGFGVVRKAYATVFAQEDELYMKNRRFELTSDIVTFDGERDTYLTIIRNVVEAHLGHGMEAKATAAAKLRFVMNPYRDAKSLPYEENTAQVTNLSQDLEQPANVAYLATLGLTDEAALLKQANENFDETWQKRSDEMLSRKEADNMKAIRAKVDDAYRTVTNAVTAFYQANEYGAGDPDVKAEFEAVIDRLNAIILKMNQTLSRRSGGSASTSTDTPK